MAPIGDVSDLFRSQAVGRSAYALGPRFDGGCPNSPAKQFGFTSIPEKRSGDVDRLKVFATARAAEERFEENDPEGVAFEYEVLE